MNVSPGFSADPEQIQALNPHLAESKTILPSEASYPFTAHWSVFKEVSCLRELLQFWKVEIDFL